MLSKTHEIVHRLLQTHEIVHRLLQSINKLKNAVCGTQM